MFRSVKFFLIRKISYIPHVCGHRISFTRKTKFCCTISIFFFPGDTAICTENKASLLRKFRSPTASPFRENFNFHQTSYDRSYEILPISTVLITTSSWRLNFASLDSRVKAFCYRFHQTRVRQYSFFLFSALNNAVDFSRIAIFRTCLRIGNTIEISRVRANPAWRHAG